MADTDTMFVWSKPVPEDWSRALLDLAPPADRVAHLQLFWVPGSPVSPIQRWAIYECTPMAFCQEKVADLLASPSCRCAVTHRKRQVCRRCKRMASATRDAIYRYLHETGCLAEPFWVIEGDDGGHKYEYSLVEAEWDRAIGGSGEAPEIGSLPYADFDGRVIRKLRTLDRVRSAWRTLQQAQAGQEAALTRQFRQALIDHAMSYDEALVDSAARHLSAWDQPTLDDRPEGRIAQDPDWWQDHYLRTGRLPGVPQLHEAV
jgi:hypothetical protein